MHLGRSVRRSFEIVAIAAVSFVLLLCANPRLEQNFLFDTLEAVRALHGDEAGEAERARRLGDHLEKTRRQEISAVQGIADALRESRGGFASGVLHLAQDARGRLLIGGWEDEGRWLGILRYRANGSIDEGSLREVSRNFEDDLVVGGVNQILPLGDGHIIAVGYFRKPRTNRARADDPGGISFVR